MAATGPDLWNAARRAARDGRKRAVALVGLGWTLPTLWLGAMLTRLVGQGTGAAFEGLGRPIAYILEPMSRAYWADDDVGLIAYVLLQLLALTLLWGYFGGRMHRLAIVDLAAGKPEDVGAAHTFAARRWRTFAGSRLALWLGFWVPLGVGVLLASSGRLPGWPGGVLLVAAVVAMVAAAFLSVLIGGVATMGGFLTGPIVAAEDSDVFDAVTRTFTYVGARLPRLCALRLKYGAGVVLGAGWRAIKTVAVAAIAWAGLHIGAGPERLDRAAAIIKELGIPHDADRLGLGVMDYALAGTVLAALAGLAAFWLADLITRVVCARSAVYLEMRNVVDRTPMSALRAAPQGPRHRNAEQAGFVEVDRAAEPSQ